MSDVTRVGNWTLVPGQTWWLVDSPWGEERVLAHVAEGGMTLCGLALPLSPESLRERHMVCGNCARVMESRELRAEVA